MSRLVKKKTTKILLIAGIATVLGQNLYSANTKNSGTVYGGSSDRMPNARSPYGWTISQELGPEGLISTGESRNMRISIGVESEYVNKTQGLDKFTGKTLDDTTGGVNASVSFGNSSYKRQLKNVENGIDDYDAVNVSQLNAVAESIKNSASPETYFHVNTADAKKPTEKPGNSGTGNANSNLGGIGDAAGATGVGATAAGINAKAQGNTSVAIGKDATVKANLTHAEASYHGTGSVAIGSRSVTDREGSVAIGHRAEATGWRSTAMGVRARATEESAIAIGNSAISSGWGSTAVGTISKATGYNTTAVGNKAEAAGEFGAAFGTTAQATKEYSTALGTLSKSVARESLAVGLHALSAGHSSVATGAYSSALADKSISLGNYSSSMGENSISAGTKSTAQNVNTIALGNRSISSGENALTLGSTSSAFTQNSIALGTGAIAGASTTDGLRTAAEEYFEVQKEYTKLEKILEITSPNVNSYRKLQEQMNELKPELDEKKQAYENALANNIDKENTIAIGANSVADVANSVALGNNSTTMAAAENATKGIDNSYTADTVIVGNDSLNLAFAGGDKVTGVVSVGNADTTRRIQNVAPGWLSATSTDAINGSQLYATNKVLGNVAGSVKNILGGNAELKPDGTITISNIANTGKNNIDDAIKAARTIVKSSDNSVTITPTEENGSYIYDLKVVKKEGITKEETVVSGNSGNVIVTSEKTNDTGGKEFVVDIAKNLDLGDNGSIKTGNTVINNNGLVIEDGPKITNKGIDAGNKKITNVAAGEADTDAVNVSQLKATNNQINHIENRLDDVEDKMDKGFANLTAMATLEFMEIGVNQVAVGAAVGTYGGRQAVAVGVQGAPTENTRIYAKASASPGRKSKAAAGVGATWRFNLK